MGHSVDKMGYGGPKDSVTVQAEKDLAAYYRSGKRTKLPKRRDPSTRHYKSTTAGYQHYHGKFEDSGTGMGYSAPNPGNKAQQKRLKTHSNKRRK